MPKSGTRPTSERVREALFSHLEHYGYVRGSVVLDLFAGSGALALEAISRGADRAVAVDMNPTAAKLIRANARAVGFAQQTHVVTKKADSYLAADVGTLPEFDVAFLDPPYSYSEDELSRTLELLAPHLPSEALIVVERAAQSEEPRWPAGFTLCDERKMGDTRVWSAERALESDSIKT